MMLKTGDMVTLYDPGSADEHESWMRGRIRATLSSCRLQPTAVHILSINGFKWDRDAPWGPYDGVPECIARETDGSSELEWIDTWPRRSELQVVG